MSYFDQEALDRASWELQRHFGREGSIYGIKACEEIARIALAAYGTLPEAALISAAKEYVAAFYENNPGENKCSCRQCQATMALVRAVREAEALPQVGE